MTYLGLQISGGIFWVYIIIVKKDNKEQDRHEWQLRVFKNTQLVFAKTK